MHETALDVATVWRKSSYSSANGNCVEVAVTPGVVGVRDTKNRQGGQLELAPAAWAMFLDTLR